MTSEVIDNSISFRVRAQNKKFLLRTIALTIINVIMFTLVPLDNRTVYERLVVALSGLVISLPLIGFVLAIFIGLFPYKGLGYGKRYLRSGLLVVYWFNLLTSVLMILATIPIILIALS